MEPTCTAEGYTQHDCSRCGLSYRDTIVPALGHKTELRNAKEATCTEDGYTGDEVCTVCGEIVKRGEVVPATGHSWDEGVVKVEPGCAEEGVMLHTCTVCGETKEENISAKGHQYEKTVVAPTCTTDAPTPNISPMPSVRSAAMSTTIISLRLWAMGKPNCGTARKPPAPKMVTPAMRSVRFAAKL